MMKVSVLASGSSGNSTYVESDSSKILIDAGLNCKQLSNRLSDIGHDLSEINAIFVTHEHIDHIRGLQVISNRYDVPMYINNDTYDSCCLSLRKVNHFNTQPIQFNGFKIQPVHTSHDAAKPCGFVAQDKNKKVGVFTDLGCITKEVKDSVSELNAIVLESNHDIDMLINGPYPYHLKQRILSNKGHLSNIDAALFIKEHAPANLKTVFLAHLSRNNNTPGLAHRTFSKLVDINIKTILTDQFEPTELLNI